MEGDNMTTTIDLTSLQKLPTLTEIFFGKGIDPATDKPYVENNSEEPIEEVLTEALDSNDGL